MTRKLTIGIDLDGVCYDFVDALRRWSHKAYGLDLESMPDARWWDFFKLQWSWTTPEYLERFADGVRAGYIFRDGDPMPGVVEALDRLRSAGHEIVIVTHRSVKGAEDECRESTFAWLAEHGIPHDRVIITGAKTALGLDLILDDAPHNIEAATAVGERAIYWTQAWNLLDSHERVFSWPEFEQIVQRVAEEAAPDPANAPTVIGITGYAQTGKDTAGSFLAEQGFERIAFADALREILLATDPMVPVPRTVTYPDGLAFLDYDRVSKVVGALGWERAKTDVPEIRNLLQRLGTEGGRAVLGESVWIDAGLAKAKPGGKYVITDVRFPNEAQAIRAIGGRVWRIERPGTGAANAHASETPIADDLIDRVIVNDASPAALRARVLSEFTPA